MKVEIQARERELPFPKLMINKYETIILFYRDKCGTTIKSNEPGDKVGMNYADLNMSDFVDFRGVITITQ